jgi:SNF2 family DNA or RNA helicase
MAIKIIIENGYGTAYGPFPMSFLSIIGRLANRKIWTSNKSVRFQASPHNIEIIKNSTETIEWEDKTGDLADIELLRTLPSQHDKIDFFDDPYIPRKKLFNHQLKAKALMHDRRAYALFFEMGLGKSATVISNFGSLYKQGKLTGVLIVSPKGVHSQWLAEAIPDHLDVSIKLNMTLWDSSEEYENDDFNEPGCLNVFSINIDAIRGGGNGACAQFLGIHRGKVMMIIDESHYIMDYGSKRTQAAIKLGKSATFRRILTGTPIAKSLEDAWSQFMFLDPKIIGIYQVTLFRAKFCDEFNHAKCVEEFYSLTAPHCFRITKEECTDLPEKIRKVVPYQHGKETKRHYENIKNSFMTELSNGDIVDPENGLAALIRLQQINSGFLPRSDGTFEIISYERSEIALDIVNQISGKIIIWCRFIQDIAMLRHSLKKYSSEICTIKDVDDLKTGKKRIGLLNPASGGTGLDLRPYEINNMIYYSNSHNSIHRWQSEDRAHGLGMKGTLTIFDIQAQKSCDKGITNNLRAKKNLSDLALDEIRQIIDGE